MSDMPRARIAGLYRYPIKGLSAHRIDEAELSPGETIPFDRVYALANGDIPFDPDAPAFLKKIYFLMLMKNEGLARLECDFDENRHVLKVIENGTPVVEGCLLEESGRTAIELFFNERFKDELRGKVKVLSAEGHSFSDVPEKVLSLINLESLRDLEAKIGQPIDPLRFRANVYVDGIPAWSEIELVGKDLVAPNVEFAVMSRTNRCAATEVDPATGIRDIRLPKQLTELYGRVDCGVYLKVEKGGKLKRGDHLLVA